MFNVLAIPVNSGRSGIASAVRQRNSDGKPSDILEYGGTEAKTNRL
jgi:hypothetical protein